MSIDLVSPDGKPWVLDNEDPKALDEALRQGFTRPVAPKEESDIESVGNAAGTAVYSAANALTAGGLGAVIGLAARPNRHGYSDQAALDTAKFVKEQTEAHPIAAGVGELAGTVASPINAIAPLIEGPRAITAVGRIGQKVAGGAAVGSLYGAGQAINEAALGDSDVTADKLIAHVGLGALLGAAGGGFGGAIEEGVSGFVPKITKSLSGSDEALQEFANDRWLKAAGGIQSDIKKIPVAEHADVADAIRTHLAGDGVLPKSLDEAMESLHGERGKVAQDVIRESGITDAGGLAPEQSQEEALASLSKGHEAHGQRMGKVLDAADAAGASPEYSRIAQRYSDFEQGLNPAERDLVSKPLSDARRYIVDLASGDPKQQTFRALNDLKSTLQKDINWVADGTAKSGLKKQLTGVLRDEIDTQLAPQIGEGLSKEWLGAKDEFAALSRAEDALGRKTSTGMDAIRALAKNADEAPPSLNRLSALEHASNLLKHGQERALGNRWLSASDYLTGIGAGVMNGGPLGAIAGLGTSIAHKFMREKGAAVIAKLADKLAKTPALNSVAESFAKSIPALAPKLGPYGEALLRSLAVSPTEALATHMVLAKSDPTYAGNAQLAGLTPEDPAAHVASITKAHGLTEVATAAKRTDEAIGRHIDAVFRGDRKPTPASTGSQDFGAKRMRQDSVAGHNTRADEVRQLAGNPQALLDRISKNLQQLGTFAPGVSSALAARANTAVQYLAQAAAVPAKGGVLAHDWDVPDADRFAFAQTYGVVENPMSVLDYCASGTCTESQIETLKAVYPKLYEQISRAALNKLTDSTSRVPYSARLMINLLTDVDPDGSMSPDSIARNQNAIVASAKKSEAQGSPSGKKSDLSMASRTALPSQQREMGKS